MKSLIEYLNENVAPMFEARAAADTETMVQEILTCVFFDAFFNKRVDFDTTEDIIEYYESVKKSIIEPIIKMPGVRASLEDFDKLLLSTEAKGKNKVEKYTKKSEEWQKSFVLQCDAFDSWLNTHKSFHTPMVFVHHDSSIGVINGRATGGWKIADRVDNGVKKYGISEKDVYQKADIYAVCQDTETKPEDDIADEVSYWINSIEGDAKSKFVGISLKKLNSKLSNVHTYGLDHIECSIDPDSIKIINPIFNSTVAGTNLGDSKPGTTSSYLKFDANLAGDLSSCVFDIRTSGADSDSRIVVKSNQAHTCFGVTALGQLRLTGKAAQAGRAQRLISDWAKKEGVSLKRNDDADSSDFKNKFDTIKKMALDNHIVIDDDITSDSLKLIDMIKQNNDKLMDAFKACNKGNHKLTQDMIDACSKMGVTIDESNYVDMYKKLFDLVKWKAATWSILCNYEAIFKHAESSDFKTTLKEMVMFAKGISTSEKDLHLPYVMIG